MAYNRQPPCLGCERLGCGSYHDECEKYLEYINGRKDFNDKKRSEKINTWQNAYERMKAERTKKNVKAFKREK